MLNIIIICVLIIFVVRSSYSSISCRDASGASVDWYVGYKLPETEKDRLLDLGLKFLYSNGQSSVKWASQANINSSQNAIAQTLAQLYSSLSDGKTFYMLYNDDHPGNGKTDAHHGHAKGVAVFDHDSGFWLIHSVPNFPPTQQFSYPHSGCRNGQSFLCVTMTTSSLESIANQMLYIQPSIYLSQLPNEFASRYPTLQKVIANKSLNRSTTVFYSVAQLTSRSGVQFTSFAKHRNFKKDLYADLVAPQLKTSLSVQSWMNGPGDLPSACSSVYTVSNIVSIRVNDIEFKSSKDHSKWAVSKTEREPALCIGDINRQKSQSLRGGGTLCLRKNKAIWSLYNNSVVAVEPCGKLEKRSNWLENLWHGFKKLFHSENNDDQ